MNTLKAHDAFQNQELLHCLLASRDQERIDREEGDRQLFGVARSSVKETLEQSDNLDNPSVYLIPSEEELLEEETLN
jgi:hypothetical protein